MDKETRPRKAGPKIRAPSGRRVPLGLRVSATVKKEFVRVANNENITLSAAAEKMFEKLRHYEEIIAAAGGGALQDLRNVQLAPEQELAQTRAKLREQGWTWKHMGDGSLQWFEPHPLRKSSTWGEDQ